MAGGDTNPLGARALYLGKTIYRIHGTNQPSTIGTFVSSGCIRLTNEDVTDLYTRVKVGTRVVVLPGKPPPTAAASAPAAAAAPSASATAWCRRAAVRSRSLRSVRHPRRWRADEQAAPSGQSMTRTGLPSRKARMSSTMPAK
jgi:hypothetical protein